jgi:hypothetical protein
VPVRQRSGVAARRATTPVQVQERVDDGGLHRSGGHPLERHPRDTQTIRGAPQLASEVRRPTEVGLSRAQGQPRTRRRVDDPADRSKRSIGGHVAQEQRPRPDRLVEPRVHVGPVVRQHERTAMIGIAGPRTRVGIHRDRQPDAPVQPLAHAREPDYGTELTRCVVPARKPCRCALADGRPPRQDPIRRLKIRRVGNARRQRTPGRRH